MKGPKDSPLCCLAGSGAAAKRPHKEKAAHRSFIPQTQAEFSSRGHSPTGLCFECDSKLPGCVFSAAAGSNSLLWRAAKTNSAWASRRADPGPDSHLVLTTNAPDDPPPKDLLDIRRSLSVCHSSVLHSAWVPDLLLSFLLPRRQPATGAPWSSPSPTGTHATSGQPSSRRSVKHGSRRPTGSLRSSG